MSSNNEQKNQDAMGVETEQEKMQVYTNDDKSTMSMEPNIAGALCYLVGFITGIIFLLLEKENRFVRFHAMQSIVTYGFFFVLGFVLSFIPIIGWLISLLLAPLGFIMWILLMYKAYQGEMFKLPVVGDFAEQQINN